jgi:ABC-type transport system involved in cytochrome c biogenesis permease subunit
LGGLLVAGAAAVLTGLFPALVMLVAAAALTTAQRSRLARSLRALDPDLRRRRFRRSALCAVVFAASIVGYAVALADDEIGGFSLIFFNLVGTTAMVAAGVLLVMAMLTPKEPVVRARGVGT